MDVQDRNREKKITETQRKIYKYLLGLEAKSTEEISKAIKYDKEPFKLEEELEDYRKVERTEENKWKIIDIQQPGIH